MDRSESYMNVKLGKTDSQSPSRAEPDVLYAEINFKTPLAPRVRTDRDGLNSTNSELIFRKEEHRVDEDEYPPISSGPGGLSTTAQTDLQKQQPKDNIGNRPECKICLLCLVSFALVAIVVGLSIHVSQIRHPLITSDRDYQVLWEQYRTLNETKAQICQQLFNRTKKNCSEDWVANEDQCYFISKIEMSYQEAIKECSSFDSKLLEINSIEEETFVSKFVCSPYGKYWIGKCKDGKVASNVFYVAYTGKVECTECKPSSQWYPCNGDKHRFICEAAASLIPDIPEKIQNLCQQPVGAI